MTRISEPNVTLGILKSKEEQEKLAKWAREVIAEIQR